VHTRGRCKPRRAQLGGFGREMRAQQKQLQGDSRKTQGASTED